MSATLQSWAKLLGGEVSGVQVLCPGPGHGPQDRSLSVKMSANGGFVVHSFAGDDPIACRDYVRSKLGMKPFKPNGNGKASSTKRHFDYPGPDGALLYQVEREDLPDGRKKIRQRRPDGKGAWAWNLDGVRRVPYRLPELIEAVGNGNLIVIVEGEAKADLLWSWNVPATCNSGGAGKWRSEYSAYLAGADVVILPDNDQPGRLHVDAVAMSLSEVGASVRVLDLPGLPLKGDVIDWAAAGGTAEQLHVLIDRDARAWAPSERESVNAESEELPAFAAHPFVWRDPKTIQPREWLHAGHYIRGFLSATIAPGGLGKTSLQLVEAVGMVCGRDLLRGTTSRPLNVWYWNLEDPLDEIDRRIAAILLHYNIAPGSSEGRLFVNCEEPLVIATRLRDETVVAAPVVGRLISEITRLQIDVLTVDPFVSSHRVPENDNGAIDAVAKTWSRIARTCNCAVEVAHHIRKPASGSTAEITVDDARGAGALKDAGRSLRVLNVMSKEEAETISIKPVQRRCYFHIDDGKANMKPPAENIDWRKIVSVPLDNGTEED